ncbi:MAG: hypothetical protein L0177_16830 [Chloroflexi bacterium]|nr:hypothetical protein [Chloroflexota bacterium]
MKIRFPLILAFSRQIAIPGSRVATTFSPPRKKVISSIRRSSPCSLRRSMISGTFGSCMKP